ncbi:hypothetical protein Tco_1018466 [Tanacetum coccineum]|uniref:Uncharacterized protein n=1 Tax=Tanacetum coccineum TaxID=301880 RepID=A0ABQ5FUE3_9ASTR
MVEERLSEEKSEESGVVVREWQEEVVSRVRFVIRGIIMIFIQMLHLDPSSETPIVSSFFTRFYRVALSPIRADLIPSPKRVKDSSYSTDIEVDPREIRLRDDAREISDEPHLEQDSDPEIQAEIDECFAYADALRDRGIDARVVVKAIDRDETETGVRGPVEVRVERVTHLVMPEDILEPAQEGAVEATLLRH